MEQEQMVKQMMEISGEMADITDRLAEIDCMEAQVLERAISLWGVLFMGGVSRIYEPENTKALFHMFYQSLEMLGKIAESLETNGGKLHDTSFTLSDGEADIT